MNTVPRPARALLLALIAALLALTGCGDNSFEATAHRLASEREAYPDCVLRNAGSLRDSRPVGDRFELLAARALEIRAQGAPVRS